MGNALCFGKETSQFFDFWRAGVGGGQVGETALGGLAHGIVTNLQRSCFSRQPQLLKGSVLQPFSHVICETISIQPLRQLGLALKPARKAAAFEREHQLVALRTEPSTAARKVSFEIQNDFLRRSLNKPEGRGFGRQRVVRRDAPPVACSFLAEGCFAPVVWGVRLHTFIRRFGGFFRHDRFLRFLDTQRSQGGHRS